MSQAHATESDPQAGLRERNKREKLERITRAAGDLFREQGFDGTTGRQICERAGIGTGTLFLYVRDKRDLLSLIFQPLAQKVFARLSRGLGKDERLLDGLMRFFGALFRLYARDQAISRLFVQDLLLRGDPSPELQKLNDELEGRLVELVHDAQARSELRSDIPAEVLGLAFLAHYGFWLQLWLGAGGVSRQGAVRGLRSALQLQINGAGPIRRHD
jgi:AcrR family transcriptional regulator